MASTDRRFDVRTLERLRREGTLDEAEYQEHLDNLPDAADKAEPLESEFEEDVLDDSEDIPEDIPEE